MNPTAQMHVSQYRLKAFITFAVLPVMRLVSACIPLGWALCPFLRTSVILYEDWILSLRNGNGYEWLSSINLQYIIRSAIVFGLSLSVVIAIGTICAGARLIKLKLWNRCIVDDLESIMGTSSGIVLLNALLILNMGPKKIPDGIFVAIILGLIFVLEMIGVWYTDNILSLVKYAYRTLRTRDENNNSDEEAPLENYDLEALEGNKPDPA